MNLSLARLMLPQCSSNYWNKSSNLGEGGIYHGEETQNVHTLLLTGWWLSCQELYLWKMHTDNIMCCVDMGTQWVFS